MRKKLAALGLAAGLVGGGAAGFAVTGTTGIAGAQAETTTTAPATDETPSNEAPGTNRPDPSAKLAETLAPLVTDGTLTQAQADKVIAAIEAARPAGGHHGGGRGGKGRGPGAEAAATALGLTGEELRTELDAGKTIAAVAIEKGVDLTTVTDAMLAAETTKLAEKVTAGEITQAQADERLSGEAERITERVNNVKPAGGPRGERHGGPGRDGGSAPADAPAGGAGAPTTTCA